MVFNFSKKRNFPPIFIGNSELSRISSKKFVGVTFDDELKFDLHISVFARKKSCSVGLFNTLKHYMQVEAMLSLFESFVVPYLL